MQRNDTGARVIYDNNFHSITGSTDALSYDIYSIINMEPDVSLDLIHTLPPDFFPVVTLH